MVVNIIHQLIRLGFSEYEAKTYLALLKIQPATAYETAKTAGLPSSKIYEILNKLKDKGIAMALKNNEKLLYAAVDPDEFLEKQKAVFDSTIRSLESGLKAVSDEDDFSYIWNIRDYDYLIDKATRMISGAHESILLSVWPEEFSFLEELISKSNTKYAIIHFGHPRKSNVKLFIHPIQDTLYAEKGGRGFSLVSDSSEAISAIINQDKIVAGAWSKNPGFALVTEDYIKHDIYIMKIVTRFNEDLIRRFGDNYRLLRDIYTDRETEDGVCERDFYGK
ncbi:MAG: TrmB family transcriptional regulator [Spirochaetales bacterium]|nr:TrmB family transcriptional regulator [Spirochaetales bacterium]